ncbi:hypothetical protein CGRA01v4_04106 [Colletotrichum graminicola]|nr:hypothetical protein CGRA01v4_04106 [Colletotrichum graminicola]
MWFRYGNSGRKALRLLQLSDSQDRRRVAHVDDPDPPCRDYQAHPRRRPRSPRQAAPQPSRLPALVHLQDGADVVRCLHLDPYHRRRPVRGLLRLLRHLPRRAPARLARREPVARRRLRCSAPRRKGRPQVPRRLALHLPLLQRHSPPDLRPRQGLYQARDHPVGLDHLVHLAGLRRRPGLCVVDGARDREEPKWEVTLGSKCRSLVGEGGNGGEVLRYKLGRLGEF